MTLFALIEVLLKYSYEKLPILNGIYWISIIFLIFFAGFRTNSPDITAYETMHKVIRENRQSMEWRVALLEPGFKLLIWLFKSYSFNFLLCIIALMGVGLKSLVIKKYSPYLFLTLCIYFSGHFMVKEMAQVRHGISIAIALLGFAQLYRNNTKGYLLLAVLAICFHWSAICLLPIVFWYKRNISNRNYVFILICLLPIVFINFQGIIFNLGESFGLSQIEKKVSLYKEGDEKYIEKLGISSSLILVYITFCLLLLFRKKLNKKYFYANQFINIYFFAIFYVVFFNSISEFGQRTTVYFRVLDMFAFPMIISVLKFERWILTFLLCLNSFFTLNKRKNDRSMNRFFPYQSIFFEKGTNERIN